MSTVLFIFEVNPEALYFYALPMSEIQGLDYERLVLLNGKRCGGDDFTDEELNAFTTINEYLHSGDFLPTEDCPTEPEGFGKWHEYRIEETDLHKYGPYARVVVTGVIL